MKEQWQTFLAQLQADKKKAAILGVLSVVMLVVLGRTLFHKAPAAVEAVERVPVTPAPAHTPAMRPVPQQASTEAAKSVEPPVARPVARPAPQPPPRAPRTVVVDGLPRVIDRDVFANREWTRFAMPAEDTNPITGTSRHESLWQILQHNLAEAEKVRESEFKRLSSRVKELKLQSTITGPSPVAYVSGRMLRPGDQIAGFSVHEIHERSLTLQKGAFTATLSMP